MHQEQSHPFDPIWNQESQILILGTMPSVLSRRNAFYYGHPQNRFWKVLASLWSLKGFESLEEKKNFLLSHGIALWDVLRSCQIELSKDSSIRDPVANDLSVILQVAPVKKIFTNGRKADELYRRLTYPHTGIEAVCLPSTSPANGRFDFPRLIGEWSVIRQYID